MLDLIGMGVANSSARKGADAIKDADQRGIGAIQGMYDQSSQNFQPYMQYGQGAGGLAGLQKLYSGDNSGWMQSPDYLAARDAGMYAMDHSAGARLRLSSPGAAQDTAKGLADINAGFLGNYRNGLQWGAGMGQQSAGQLGALGANAANNIAGLYQDQGKAMAGKYSAYGNNAGQFVNNMSSYAGSFFGGR